MARSRRIKYQGDGTLYHVMTRTVQQAFLFESPVIREWIYRKILWLGSIYFVDFYSIAIMSNHYHIVLAMRRPPRDPTELQRRFEARQAGQRYPLKWYEWRADPLYEKLSDLSEFMKELNQTVARFVNHHHNTRGHVWSDRFKSVLIEDGPGLLSCMAYVELNCVRAGICTKPSDYRWCSVGRFHQGGRKEAGVRTPSLHGFECLQKEYDRQKAFAFLVNHLAESGDAPLPVDQEELQALVHRIDVAEFTAIVRRRTRWMVDSLILGSESFCQEMIARYSLQAGRAHRPRPFALRGALFNGHQRAGPFLK